ncbi:hypothetical protein, partial [Aureimonas phyllosphaerae]
MTDDFNETPTPKPAAAAPHAAGTTTGRQRLTSRNAILGAGALGVLALGFVGGAAAWSATQHPEATFDTSLAVTPISDLESSSEVGIAGQVAEI